MKEILENALETSLTGILLIYISYVTVMTNISQWRNSNSVNSKSLQIATEMANQKFTLLPLLLIPGMYAEPAYDR